MKRDTNDTNDDQPTMNDQDDDQGSQEDSQPIQNQQQIGSGGGGGGGNKRNRRNDENVRILIPSRIAGAIIGKGGQHIQKLRSQYNCTVSVDDCQGPERTILICSDLESVLKIIREMLKYFEEKDNEYDVRVLIHQSLAGCVIGKGGEKIKEIRDKIGCRVLKVFSNVAPQSTDRIVQIVGKLEPCVEGVAQVLNVTRDTPIKGSIHNYDPINYDDLYAEDYGGFGGGGGGGMRSRARDRQIRFDRRGDGGRNNGDGGRFGGGGGRGDRNRRDRSRSDIRRGGSSGNDREREYINPWANDIPLNNMNSGCGFGGINFGSGGGGPTFGSGGNIFSSPGGNAGYGGGSGGGYGGGSSINFGSGPGGSLLGNGVGGGNMGGGGGNMGGMNNGGSGSGGDKNSTQVTIPKDLAGAIIGKGGGRIRRIRNESGAYITIDEPLAGSNDRIITISGNPKQIQMAQYLLQQSVHDNANRRKF